MLGVVFYRQFQDEARTQPTGNVVAALMNRSPIWDSTGEHAWYPVVCACEDKPNADVHQTYVSLQYLRTFCQPICERVAAEVHPRLLAWLDNEGSVPAALL